MAETRAEIRKSSNSIRALLEAFPPTAPRDNPTSSPRTPSPGTRAPTGRQDRPFGKVRGHSPRPHFPPRVTGPSHAGRPPPRRGHQTVGTAPPCRFGARFLPPAPPPGRGAPRGNRLTGATLAHTPGRPLLPAAPRSPARASSRLARRVPPRPPVTAPSPGGVRGAGRGGRTWRARRWPAARRGVSRRPGRGRGAGAGSRPSLRASAGPRSRPAPAGRREAAPTCSPVRTPALLPPRPYGNLQPQKVTRRRFLGLSTRPPPPEQRSCRGDSGRGSGFLGQNLLGGRGARGSPGATAQIFFFFTKKNLPVSSFFQALLPKGTGGGPKPSQTRPQSGGQPRPGPVYPGNPGERGAPQHSGAKFSPGTPARPERSRTGIHLGGLGVRLGLSRAPGPGGRSAESRSPPISRSCTPYLPSG